MLNAERTNRHDRFNAELGRLLAQAAKTGRIVSSGYFSAIEEAASIEVENGTRRAWETLHRVLISTGIAPSHDLAVNLKNEFSEIFSAYCEPHAANAVAEARKRMGAVAPPAAAGKFIHRAISARQAVDAEIDLFVRSLEFNARSIVQAAPGTVFNFYHPVGVIQTGAGSAATIVQNLGEAARQEVIGALDQINNQLQSTQQLSAQEVHEIREAIDETRRELQKADPGRAILWAKLQTAAALVAAAVPSMPTLQAGYHVLVSVLRSYGLPVP